ncbi:MAG TPA: Ig-like domain-containing protein [Gemmatimonadaceae bacterium]|nr:Ig-like domain-containing protein [Gemmatimonadaceae bacterium]
MRTFLRRDMILAAAIPAAALSCGGGDSTGPAAKLTSIAISSATLTVLAGQTLQLTASPRDQSGNTITATVSWQSQTTSIATVSQSGLVSGVAAGTASIVATATNGSTSVNKTVQVAVLSPPVLTTVTLSATTATTIFLGSTTQLVATTLDQRGAPIAANVTWSSSANGIASVDATGTVTGNALGSATITASATAAGTTVPGTVNVTVSNAAPVLASVSVATSRSTFAVGETAQLTATTKDQYGHAVGADVAWSSSSTGIATVNAAGLVTGVGIGPVTITGTGTLGAASAAGSVNLTVGAPPPLTADVTATVSNQFVPSLVDIARGGTVTWTFQATHNVTFSNTTGGAPQGISDTSTGSVSRTFATSGTFTYECTIHAGMRGTVVVH